MVTKGSRRAEGNNTALTGNRISKNIRKNQDKRSFAKLMGNRKTINGLR
jgi:hypothetical protein